MLRLEETYTFSGKKDGNDGSKVDIDVVRCDVQNTKKF